MSPYTRSIHYLLYTHIAPLQTFAYDSNTHRAWAKCQLASATSSLHSRDWLHLREIEFLRLGLRIPIGISILMLLASCTGIQQFTMREAAPELGYRYLELLFDDTFENGEHWRSYSGGADLFLGAKDGVYRIDFSGRRYVWTQGERQYADLVMEAEAKQISDYDHNGFGLACRLDPANSGRGYYFLISGDGYASIRWSNGRSLERIVVAAPSSHIRRGRDTNLIRAVCIEDYLALWVNGEFIAEARDRRASEGAVGFVGVMNNQGRRLTVDFDDLRVWRAALDDHGS